MRYMVPLGAKQVQWSSQMSGNAVKSVDFLAISKTPSLSAQLRYKVLNPRKLWLRSRSGENGKWVKGRGRM